MKILIACEESQTVCKAFRELWFEAYSCDIQECSWGHPEWHIQWDAIQEAYSGKYDMMIAHPPCTYLSVSWLHWNKRDKERALKTEKALEFVQKFMDAPVKYIAIENPISCISTRIRKPEQIINPYNFWWNASKKTCLWLKNLPILKHWEYVEPRIVDWKKRWWNQMDNWQNITLWEDWKVCWWNTEKIKKLRSKTFPWIAKAMAEQWGNFITL